MRWGLLVNDLLARLIGLVGITATIVYGMALWGNAAQDSPYLMFTAGVAVFTAAFSLCFLLPGTFERALRRTLSWWLRLPFIALIAIWTASIAAATFTVSRAADVWGVSSQTTSYWPLVIVGLLIALAVVVFPIGLGYRETKATKASEAVADDSPELDDFDASAQPSYNVTFDEAPDYAPGALDMPTDEPQQRKADFLDLLVGIPFVVALLGGLYAFRIGNTVHTAEHGQFVQENIWLVAGAVVASVFVPVSLNLLIRGRPAEKHTFGRPTKPLQKALTMVFGAPILAYVIFIFVTYDLFPMAWNTLTRPADGIVVYEVGSISTGRKLRGCVTLQDVKSPDQDMMVCGLGSSFVDQLSVGARIEASGPLSPYGHTIEAARILR